MLPKKSSAYITPPTSLQSSRNTSTTQLSLDLSEDCEFDKDAMSSRENLPPRPLTVAIPATAVLSPASLAPKRPTLREILSNTSAPPWNLTAFMAYLSNNHCLETLEFTLDAGRYRKHYEKMCLRIASDSSIAQKERENVQVLWQKLVDAYIRPSGSREVNLPSDVRDPILNIHSDDLPPHPSTLDLAVLTIYELMEESVVIPFLNSSAPAIPQYPPSPFNPSDLVQSGRPIGPAHSVESTERPSRPANAYTHHRQSAPSTLTSTLGRTRLATRAPHITSSPGNALAASLSAPAGSSDVAGYRGRRASITAEGNESPTADVLMTPPTSPPMSDVSPKRDSGMWKKLGRLGKKPKPHGLHREDSA